MYASKGILQVFHFWKMVTDAGIVVRWDAK